MALNAHFDGTVRIWVKMELSLNLNPLFYRNHKMETGGSQVSKCPFTI